MFAHDENSPAAAAGGLVSRRQGRDGRLRGHRPQRRRQGAHEAVLHRRGRRGHRPGQAHLHLPQRREPREAVDGLGRLGHDAPAGRRAPPAAGAGLGGADLRQGQGRVDGEHEMPSLIPRGRIAAASWKHLGVS